MNPDCLEITLSFVSLWLTDVWNIISPKMVWGKPLTLWQALAYTFHATYFLWLGMIGIHILINCKLISFLYIHAVMITLYEFRKLPNTYCTLYVRLDRWRVRTLILFALVVHSYTECPELTKKPDTARHVSSIKVKIFVCFIVGTFVFN